MQVVRCNGFQARPLLLVRQGVNASCTVYSPSHRHRTAVRRRVWSEL